MSLSVPAFASKNQTDEQKQLTIEIDKFINEMVDKHNFQKKHLQKWFENAKPNNKILKTINRPAEAALPWHRYRDIFIQQERVDKGLVFWKEHAKVLARAEKKYGVPAEVIVGLIGVETKYGRIKGNYDVFNALYTLGFHFPRRSKFFKKELKEFLLLAREQAWSVASIKGSYAGAMGYGQFMPSSYRMYAVDFDDDGKIDLLDNPVDAIGSVANYINVHGWKKGKNIVHKANVSGDEYKSLMKNGLKPHAPIKHFHKAGVESDDELHPELNVLLIELTHEESKEYWFGLHNFYVISRYNPRKLYTMAVIQLTEQLKSQYKDETNGDLR